MKLAKLTNVTTVEAAGLIAHLGGQTLSYRDVPLLNATQIEDLIAEMRHNEADAIMFDTGALFDRSAYEIARDAVDALILAFPERFKVVVFNTPGYARSIKITTQTS